MWQNKKRISVVEENSFITFNQVKDTRLKVYTKVQTTGYTHHQGGQIGLYQKTSRRALFSQTNQVYLHQNEGRSKKSSWSEAHHITHVSSFYQLCETAKVKSFLSPKNAFMPSSPRDWITAVLRFWVENTQISITCSLSKILLHIF